MSRPQMPEMMARLGQMLASLVDMAKGTMGDQFAVSIVCRHINGPCHILIGDDPELAIIRAMSELQRTGLSLIRNGEDQPVEPSVADHMINLLRETSEGLGGLNPIPRAEQLDLCARIDDVLEQIDAQSKKQTTTVFLTDPAVGDMDDAPATDGRPERKP